MGTVLAGRGRGEGGVRGGGLVVSGRDEGPSHQLARVGEAPGGAAVVQRGAHEEVGHHLVLVGVDRLLTRGELADAVERDRRDARHVVVRRAVGELPRRAAARVEDGDRVGGRVGHPQLARVRGVPGERRGLRERHALEVHHRARLAERDGASGGGSRRGGGCDGHLLTSPTVTAHFAREVERAGRAHHGLVQVGRAPRAAAMAGGGELGRSAEVAAIVLGRRLHQVEVVVAVVLEVQLVAHGNTVRAGARRYGRPEIGAGADGHGGCGGREHGGGGIECGGVECCIS